MGREEHESKTVLGPVVRTQRVPLQLTVAVAVQKAARNPDKAHELYILAALSDHKAVLADAGLDIFTVATQKATSLDVNEYKNLPVNQDAFAQTLALLLRPLAIIGAGALVMSACVEAHLGPQMEDIGNQVQKCREATIAIFERQFS